MYVCFACLYMCAPHTCMPGSLWGLEESIKFPGSGITESYEPLRSSVTWTQILWRAANNYISRPSGYFFLKKKSRLMVSLTWTNNNCWKKSNAYFLSKLTELVMVIYKAFSVLSLCYYLISVLNWRNDMVTISTLIGNMISSVCVYNYLSIEMKLFAWKTKSKVVKINVWVDIHW